MIRQSTGLRNHLQQGGSFRSAFTGGVLEVFTGPQPATADAATAGTKLVRFTASAGTHVPEVRATGTITLTGGAGSVDTIKVGGIEILGVSVPFDTSLTVTAAAVAAQINAFHGHKLVTASSVLGVVTLTAARGYGATVNNVDVTTTTTTLGATDVDLGDATLGVSAVNGLSFEEVAAGLLAKLATQQWSGFGLADGTVGYFRLKGAILDSDAEDSAGLFCRMDGNVATAGADMNASSTTLAADALHIVGEFSPTEPVSCGV